MYENVHHMPFLGFLEFINQLPDRTFLILKMRWSPFWIPPELINEFSPVPFSLSATVGVSVVGPAVVGSRVVGDAVVGLRVVGLSVVGDNVVQAAHKNKRVF